MGDLPYLDLVANGHKFFLTQQTLEGLPHLPGLENGPGFDSQGSVNFFTKYCFPNLHRIHVKAFEVEDCEFVPVHHQPKVIKGSLLMRRNIGQDVNNHRYFLPLL